ncbi:nitrophenyl compound nitroreductase subunit ArsF family protein [Yeosuana marina]|uniref:nitrophenyl compound nitroreductase subunit ArsF family protein n=1 Tax=Yeosuana marina TaxID=1565536 RepID=UPI0030EDC195|tara:strand:+ start:8348 stop:8788 length:441 start_codon:yes stop_codon:yes gene_type:complete
MKLFKFTSILAITLLFLTSCKDKETSQNVSTNKSISKIEVIDFHSTHRCMTCKAIEANTKFTLDTYFNKDVKDGNITFRVINVDEKENEKLAEKFQASGTALFLNVIKNGEEKHIDLTEFAFMEGNDQDVFSKELKDKIENELKTL